MRSVRSCASALRLAVVCVLALTQSAGADAADRGDLRETTVAPGTILAANEGSIAAVDPSSGDLTVWSERGTLSGRYRLGAQGPAARPIGLAIRGDTALVAYSAGDDTNIDAVLVDLSTGRERGRFTVPEYPSRVAAVPDGWLFERLEPGRAPSLTVVGNDGHVVRALDLPPGLVDRATKAFGDASVAFVRPIVVGRTLWFVPSLAYELWSLSAAGSWSRIEVPNCLSANARRVEGEVARRRMQEQADQAPAGERQRLEERIELTRRLNLRVSSYVTAARTVSARTDRLAVLIEPYPERASDACRLDVWRAGEPRPLAVMPIAGACPSFVALTTDGVWIRQGARLTWLRITRLGSADPCEPSRD